MFTMSLIFFFFFFNDTATTEIYTLSLHDALPISPFHSSDTILKFWSCFDRALANNKKTCDGKRRVLSIIADNFTDRKSTRLNSSHGYISYAVFCLKKKKKTT